MKHGLLAACGLSACVSCGVTQAQVKPEEVRVSAMTDRGALPPQLRNVWYDAFETVAGEYALSNGATLGLSMWGNRMYARIGASRVQLVAVSPYVFVGLGQPVRIAVQQPESSSSGRVNATVQLPAQMLSAVAPSDTFVELLAQR